MGCNIHEFLEIKKKESNEEWRLYIRPSFHKNDFFFRLLAGVRIVGPCLGIKNINTCLIEPKGIPKDISLEVQVELNEYKITNLNWYTPSWLNREELLQIYDKYQQEYHDKKLNKMEEVELLIDVMKTIEHKGYLTRFVFWFDN